MCISYLWLRLEATLASQSRSELGVVPYRAASIKRFATPNGVETISPAGIRPVVNSALESHDWNTSKRLLVSAAIFALSAASSVLATLPAAGSTTPATPSLISLPRLIFGENNFEFSVMSSIYKSVYFFRVLLTKLLHYFYCFAVCIFSQTEKIIKCPSFTVW